MLCHVFCEFARRTIPHPVPALLLSQDDPCHSSQAPLKSGFSRFCQWKAELGDCRAGGWKKLECLSLPPSLVASLAGPVFSCLQETLPAQACSLCASNLSNTFIMRSPFYFPLCCALFLWLDMTDWYSERKPLLLDLVKAGALAGARRLLHEEPA